MNFCIYALQGEGVEKKEEVVEEENWEENFKEHKDTRPRGGSSFIFNSPVIKTGRHSAYFHSLTQRNVDL